MICIHCMLFIRYNHLFDAYCDTPAYDGGCICDLWVWVKRPMITNNWFSTLSTAIRDE